MVEQVYASGRRGQVGGIRHGGQLVTEIGPGDDRTGGDSRRQVETAGYTHQAYAQSARHGPRAADTDRHDGADRGTGGIEYTGVQDLNAVINHCRHRATQNPGANQHTDCQQYEGWPQADSDSFDNSLLCRTPGDADTTAHQRGDAGAQHQGDLVGAVGGVRAEKVDRAGQQGDQKDDGCQCQHRGQCCGLLGWGTQFVWLSLVTATIALPTRLSRTESVPITWRR